MSSSRSMKVFETRFIRSNNSKDPTLVLCRILVYALYSESPWNARMFFPYEDTALFIYLDPIRRQPLPNPANRLHAGIQQRVVPSLHLENLCWRGERKER